MSAPSYSDIQEKIERDLGDLNAPETRQSLVAHLTELTFEMNRLREQQRTLLAAVRARDILIREHGHTGAIAPASAIELNPRDALDTSDGLHDIEWDKDVAFRWTGPGRDTMIRVWLDRAFPITFELALHSYGDKRNRGAIGLTVDGAPIAFKEVSDRLLRSEPFPVIGGSLSTEVGLHVPWLSGKAGTPTRGTAAKSSNGAKRGPASSAKTRKDDDSLHGVAIARMRFVVPA